MTEAQPLSLRARGRGCCDRLPEIGPVGAGDEIEPEGAGLCRLIFEGADAAGASGVTDELAGFALVAHVPGVGPVDDEGAVDAFVGSGVRFAAISTGEWRRAPRQSVIPGCSPAEMTGRAGPRRRCSPRTVTFRSSLQSEWVGYAQTQVIASASRSSPEDVRDDQEFADW